MLQLIGIKTFHKLQAGGNFVESDQLKPSAKKNEGLCR